MTSSNQLTTTTGAVALRGCAHQRASEVVICEPWRFEPNVPTHLLNVEDKSAYRTWCQDPATEHLFFNASEGTNPSARTSSGTNPIVRIHGLVADYDSLCNESSCASIPQRCSPDVMPNWVSRTFSGGARLVWLFEQPLALENAPLRKEFLKLAVSELRLKKLLAGLDEPAWFDLHKMYDVGRDWRALAVAPLPSAKIHSWLVQASRKTAWAKHDSVIPLEVVAEEVEKQFPGKWSGEFSVGARGPAFWAGGTNETACIIVETGMIAFSLEKIFFSWAEIVGAAFVKKYQEDRIGGAIEGTWYDGRGHYYLKDARGVFMLHSKDDFVTRLKVKHGLHHSKMGRETYTEVEQALHFIQENRRVEGAIPCLYSRNDIIRTNGKRFVNSSTIAVTQPAETEQEYGENFPWLASFFDACWDTEPVRCVLDGHAPASARDVFFSWFRRFYCSALQGSLLKGQSLFLVGMPNCGKTLLSSRIIGGAMGGYCEASDFLTSKSQFNKELFDSPIWAIDDGTMSTEPNGHQKFSETVKRAVANKSFSYQPKFFDQLRAEWVGRVVVTLNSDPSSVRMIPNLDQSMEDKIIILKFADETVSFPHDVEKTIERELPYFLRWLCDYQVPAEIVGQSRFGLKAFIHEGVRAAALNSGEVGDLLEIIEIWIKRTRPIERCPDGKWHGLSAEWVAELNADDGLRPLISKFSPRQVGRKLAEASRIPGSRITIEDSKVKGNGNRYYISVVEESSARSRVLRVAASEFGGAANDQERAAA